MSKHSVAEAKNQLSKLIDRALKGEEVTITCHSQPVVELKPVTRTPRPLTRADVEWVIARRPRTEIPAEDAGTFVSRMRDEDWQK